MLNKLILTLNKEKKRSFKLNKPESSWIQFLDLMAQWRSLKDTNLWATKLIPWLIKLLLLEVLTLLQLRNSKNRITKINLLNNQEETLKEEAVIRD